MQFQLVYVQWIVLERGISRQTNAGQIHTGKLEFKVCQYESPLVDCSEIKSSTCIIVENIRSKCNVLAQPLGRFLCTLYIM